MDHVPHTMDMQMRVIGHMSNNPEPQQFSVSNERMGLVGQLPNNPGFNTLMAPNNVVGHGESSGINMGLSPNGNQLAREGAVMVNNMTGYNTSLPAKRKAEMVPMLNTSNSLSAMLHNKLPAHMAADVSSHAFLHPSPHRKTGSPQPNSPRLQAQNALNKKVALNESMGTKSSSQRGRPAKKQTTQIESASKFRPETSEAVRSKMRENLASALALASQKRDDVSNTVKDQTDATVTHQMPVNTQVSQSDSALNGNVSSGSQDLSKGVAFGGTTNDSHVLSAELPPNESSIDSAHGFPEFQYSSIFPDEDARFSDNFFDKDDLLQGNGLSWAFDFDMQKREAELAQNADKTKSVKEDANEHKDRGEVANSNPENLAFKIEAELFKLFGGVNKKYKERGRSLLFNIKDRNNPELRERVMSGEIPPERLCSMSAEELASKELSEWRMSKAEEMAQMVVLPDTDGDMRRLVKKTHKGEYQVEFERDHDGIVDEVSVGTSMLTRAHPKKETEISASKASLKDEKNVSENHDFSGSLIIPTDGADLMQGMMVDELKDTESLPPIVSLDEFMESLNSEPPFENMSADGVQKASESHEERPKIMSNSKASDHALDSPKDVLSKKADIIKKHEIGMTIKSSKSPTQNVLSSNTSEADWEGILQLNISSSVTVRSQFQSGEKTSLKEWPASLEIKGRVRLDSFEKFLQELPMSRTRAVMVLYVALKDSFSEKQQRDFSEAIDSYSTDERLGFAEPVPGVELYLCPHTPRMAEILSKHLPKHRLEANVPTENALIGVVVWRRAHVSSNNVSSPNSSSHNKHTMKKQQHSVPNRMQNSSNATNVNAAPIRPSPSEFNNVLHKPVEPEDDDDDDDDDVPPGFGPGTAKKDDDDLPEYNFSGDLNQSVPRIPTPQNLHHGASVMAQRPVDQVRELIKKYGQSGTGGSGVTTSDRNLGIEPWNDDDDDDIPEWQPEAMLRAHNQPVALGHRPPNQMLSTSQLMPPMVNPQPPQGATRTLPGGRWVQPQGPPRSARWRPY